MVEDSNVSLKLRPSGFSRFRFIPLTSVCSQALTVPIYTLGGLTYLACSWYSDRIQQRGPFAMASITVCIVGYILLIANISPGASFAGCFIVAAGLYTAAGTPFSWGPVNNPRYGKRAIASGIQLTIGNASGVAAPFLFSSEHEPTFIPGYAGEEISGLDPAGWHH